MGSRKSPPALTVFPASESSTLQVRVVFHETPQALQATWALINGFTASNVVAFCVTDKPGNADNLCATMHFCDTGAKRIEHECFHAVLAYARHSHLNPEHIPAEELMAEAYETIIKGVRAAVRARRASRRQSR